MIVRARVRLRGSGGEREAMALVDTGARMTVVDTRMAGEVGVQYTGRELAASVSGHAVKALEALVPELEMEGETLRYEPVAVAELPDALRRALSGLSEELIIGLLTLERADMVPDTTTGTLKKAEAFILST